MKYIYFLFIVMVLLTSCASELTTSASGNSSAESTETLRNIASQKGIYIGSAVADTPLFSKTEPYSNIFVKEFNMMVAENEMKFEYLQTSSNVFYWFIADRMVNVALANNMQIRGHALLWHNQSGWASSVNNPAALSNILSNHIFTVMRRYSNKIAYWDVVNEAIEVNNSMVNSSNFYDHLRKSFWWTNLGSNYVEYAFQLARAADPTAKLFYNDYGIERYNNNPKAFYAYQLVSNLKAKGLIDGVGFQMHIDTNFKPFENGFELNLKRYSDIGVEIQITEMDVRIPVPANSTLYSLQANTYREVLSIALSNSNFTAIVFWGFTDKYSWIPDFFSGFGDALLFNTSYQKKPSYDAVMEVLKNK
ncbi:MAG: endo-1,4-beta-xylanase [Brevinematales bacterium]|nr:endo-1,4-beta-xylanase [Brevinematales bacterium]